jgi:penicillin-binding protein 1A
MGVNLQVKKDGTIKIGPAPDTGDRPPRPPPDTDDQQ